VCSLRIVNQKAAGVSLPGSHLGAGMVVNCAGAWARQIAPHRVPTHPVRGQMLCVALPEPEFLRHVVRTPDVYLIPRSDGRLLIGATAEDAGFDKQTVPATLQKLRQAAIDLVPPIGHAPVLEAWAGLRPGTPDKLPILGTTPTPGYFVATGHFRDGILLAPATAHVMAQLITGERPGLDLQPFRLERFEALHEETRLLPDHDTQNQDVQEQDRHNTEDIQNENARSFSRH
jgi:glycine oxidase